jgi:hypothetical protein
MNRKLRLLVYAVVGIPIPFISQAFICPDCPMWEIYAVLVPLAVLVGFYEWRMYKTRKK